MMMSLTSYAEVKDQTYANNNKLSEVDFFNNDTAVNDKFGEFIGGLTFEEYMKYLYGDFYVMRLNSNGIVEEINLYFTYHSQLNLSWAKILLLKGSVTIGHSGCALTSTTMAMNYLGYSDNPLQFNNKMNVYQPPGDANMYWDNVPKAYPGVSKPYSEGVTYSTISDALYEKVRGQIRLNRPVIIGMVGPSTTHFVIARGILETEYNSELGFIAKKYIHIHDPGVKNYTSLEQYTNDGYVIKSLKSYNK